MKVKETTQSTNSTATVKDVKSPEASSGDFLNVVKNVEEQSVVTKLRKLAEDIAQQGAKLGDKIDIRELRVYKKMISDFMDEAVGNSRKFSKQSFLDRRGKHRVYAVIKKVNEELDELTKEVLYGEKDRIKILKRLDEIKGLILDIVM